jgi:hypothetical protein
MVDAVTKWAFPGLFRVASKVAEEERPERARVAKALRRDLVDLLKYVWRRAQTEKRTDEEGALLRHLRLTTTPPWLRQLLEREKARRDGE